MEIKYMLDEKVKTSHFVKGELLDSSQTLSFGFEQLSPRARELWVQLFGASTTASLHTFRISGGEVFEDGLVSRNMPRVVTDSYYQADRILTPADLEKVLGEILDQKRMLEAELPQRIQAWDVAKTAWEKAQAEEQAQAEARVKRLASLPWLKRLTEKLAVEEKAKSEVQRFCTKFSLAPEDIKTQRVTYEPYIYVSASVPVNIAGMERQLRITNKVYHSVGEEADDELAPEFSDLSQAIAKNLADIFNGEVKIAVNVDMAFLNVEVDGVDTIQVDCVDLQVDDC